jgi:hypothetical protein
VGGGEGEMRGRDGGGGRAVTLSGAYKESRKRGGARIVSGHPGSAIVNISIPLDTAQGRGTVQYIRHSIPSYQAQGAQYHQDWALIMHKRHITIRHTRMNTDHHPFRNTVRYRRSAIIR